MTSKTNVLTFGVILIELITSQHPLSRDNKEPIKMISLVLEVGRLFKSAHMFSYMTFPILLMS